MGYTIYIITETRLGITNLEISLLNVKIEAEPAEALFSLRIHNPSNAFLKLHYMRTNIYYLNESAITQFMGTKETGFSGVQQSLHAGTNRNVTIRLELGNSTFSEVGWTLDLLVLVDSVLPQRGTHSTVLEI
jgi:hypothetical protein